MRYALILYIWFCASYAYAEENTLPICQPLAVQNASIALKAKKPILIFVHNHSKVDLWITHPVIEVGLNQGHSSTHLEPEQWSVLVLDKEIFELGCVESRPGHEQQVSCAGFIEACEWPNISIPEKFKGTFWASENMPLKEVYSNLGVQGFTLPASA
jgi:hypothetical protein